MRGQELTGPWPPPDVCQYFPGTISAPPSKLAMCSCLEYVPFWCGLVGEFRTKYLVLTPARTWPCLAVCTIYTLAVDKKRAVFLRSAKKRTEKTACSRLFASLFFEPFLPWRSDRRAFRCAFPSAPCQLFNSHQGNKWKKEGLS